MNTLLNYLKAVSYTYNTRWELVIVDQFALCHMMVATPSQNYISFWHNFLGFSIVLIMGRLSKATRGMRARALHCTQARLSKQGKMKSNVQPASEWCLLPWDCTFLIQNMAFQIRLNLTHAEHVHAWIVWAVGINAWMNVHFHGHNTCTHTKTQLLQCRQAQVLLYFLQMVVVLQTMVLLLLHSHRWDTCSAFKVTSIS